MPTQISVERGLLTWDGQNQAEIVRDSYIGNDLVYAIVNLITNKAKVAPWGVYRIKNKDAAKRYKAMMMDREPDMTKIFELKEQAFEPVNDVRLNEMLKYPNPDDTWSDIIEQWVGFKKITGNALCIIG